MKGIAAGLHRAVRCFCILMLVLVMTPEAALGAASHGPKAQEGVLDLTGWSFEAEGTVFLSGEWELYWNRLLEPAEIRTGGHVPDFFAAVPHAWGKGSGIAGYQGHATYRLQVTLNGEQAQTLKAIYIRGIAAAYNLYWNGELLVSAGTVAASRLEMEPEDYSQMVVFQAREGMNELVLQVSNYVQRKGGVWAPVQFGNHADIIQQRDMNISGQMFIASGLVVMGLYHFALFALRKKDAMSLLAAIFCIFIALRVLVLKDALLLRSMPWIKWEWAVKIEYLSMYLGVPFITLFTQLMYPSEIKRGIVGVILAISGIFTTIVVFTPARIFTFTQIPFQTFLVFILVYWVYVLLLATVRRRVGALLNLLSAVAMIITIINDVLYHHYVIQTLDLSPYGMLLFLFVQTLVIAHKYSKAYVDAEHFSGQLSQMNQKLEGKIKERTEALEVTNAYLLYANEHLNQLENSRRELIANVTHELGTPMTSIQGYMKALLDGVIQPERQYIQIIYDKIQVAERLVQDLFDLTKLEAGQTTFHMVDVIVDELFQEHFAPYKYDVEEQGIRFCLVKPDAVQDHLPLVRVDPIRIRQVMTNLVHNALNYTEEGGTISIRGEYGRDRLIVQVADTGKGIDPAVLPNIFDRFVKGSGRRRHTKDGSGLGLAIAREIVMHHGGILTVQSELGKGSTFQFDIPVEFIPMVVD